MAVRRIQKSGKHQQRPEQAEGKKVEKRFGAFRQFATRFLKERLGAGK